MSDNRGRLAGRDLRFVPLPDPRQNDDRQNAMVENQAMLGWPKGTTISAASSGPIDVPALPPSWNTDCAKPKRPPEARRAMRADSGWNTAEPRPTSAAAIRMTM